MKQAFILLLSCAAVATLAMAQTAPPTGYFSVMPLKDSPSNAAFQTILSSPTPVPTFTYSTVAYDGKTYTGTMIGRNPAGRGKTTTTIPTQIIPLVITINDSANHNSITYDPTSADPCITGPNSPYTVSGVVAGSPIFTNNDWVMGGQHVGNTQYIDAFQRAEFWSLVGGTPYHLMLSESTLASQPLTFNGSNYSASQFGGCGNVGVININDLDTAVTNLITGPLAGQVNVGTFPILLTRNVVFAESGHSIFSSCCVLGYHGAIQVGSNLQIYSPFSFDSSGLFGGDVNTLSHEMGEAINDPAGNNPTPPWGNIGQTVGGCQGNFEVGDPLSEGFGTPTKPFTVVNNGFTYHLQELAYFNWFFGGTNLGTPGFFSNNNSFKGFAKACPAGGTN